MTLKQLLPKRNLVAALFMVSGLALIQFVQADPGTEGQIEGGNIYTVANTSKGTGFSDPANADKCETLRYRVRVHNPGPSFVSNVHVKVVLPSAAATSNVSTATLSSINADPKSVSDTATVNLSSAQTIEYRSGTTKLLNTNYGVIGDLPDGITQGGVTIGDQGVSINYIRYVQFDAKVNCPKPPEPPKSEFKCTALDVTKVDRTRYTLTARAFVQNATVQSYTFTVRNSANAVIDTKTVQTNALSAVYNFDQSTPGTYTVTAIITTDKGATVPGVCVKQIKIEKEEKPPEHPESKFGCKALEFKKMSRTNYTFTAHAFVQNATVQSYTFTTTNAANNVIDTKTVTTNALSATYDFSQSQTGTYTVTAIIATNKGSTKPEDCRKQITVEKENQPPHKPPEKPPENPPITPPVQPSTNQPPVTPAGTTPSYSYSETTPTMLPNTGPLDTTDVVGVVFSVITATSAACYVYLRRLYG